MIKFGSSKHKLICNHGLVVYPLSGVIPKPAPSGSDFYIDLLDNLIPIRHIRVQIHQIPAAHQPAQENMGQIMFFIF